VDDLTRKGQEARDGVCDAVARGAQEVERYATDAKTPAAYEDGYYGRYRYGVYATGRYTVQAPVLSVIINLQRLLR
jgi:hypothetical protein